MNASTIFQMQAVLKEFLVNQLWSSSFRLYHRATPLLIPVSFFFALSFQVLTLKNVNKSSVCYLYLIIGSWLHAVHVPTLSVSDLYTPMA